jgi:hypothetical protein
VQGTLVGWVGKHYKQSRKNPKKLVWGLAGLADSEADAGLLDPSVATAVQQILARIPD